MALLWFIFSQNTTFIVFYEYMELSINSAMGHVNKRTSNKKNKISNKICEKKHNSHEIYIFQKVLILHCFP